MDFEGFCFSAETTKYNTRCLILPTPFHFVKSTTHLHILRVRLKATEWREQVVGPTLIWRDCLGFVGLVGSPVQWHQAGEPALVLIPSLVLPLAQAGMRVGC